MGEIEDLIQKYAGSSYLKDMVLFKEIKPSHPLFVRSILFLTKKDSDSDSLLELHLLEISEKGYALGNYPCSKQNSDYLAEKIQQIYDLISESSDFNKIEREKVKIKRI